MPPTKHCWAAAGSTAPFMPPPDRRFWRNAGASAGARPAKPGSPRGYALAARHVIHTGGPIWQGGGEGEEALLGGCYRGSLTLARDRDLKAIAFPAISTGVYRFPPARAAEIAVATVAQFLADDRIPEKVIFCCFGEASADAHRAALSGIG